MNVFVILIFNVLTTENQTTKGSHFYVLSEIKHPATRLRINPCILNTGAYSRHFYTNYKDLIISGGNYTTHTFQTADVQAKQSNPLEWIAVGPDYEYPLRQSIHLSMFYTSHCV